MVRNCSKMGFPSYSAASKHGCSTSGPSGLTSSMLEEWAGTSASCELPQSSPSKGTPCPVFQLLIIINKLICDLKITTLHFECHFFPRQYQISCHAQCEQIQKFHQVAENLDHIAFSNLATKICIFFRPKHLNLLIFKKYIIGPNPTLIGKILVFVVEVEYLFFSIVVHNVG